MVKVSEGQPITTELQIKKVEARLNNVPIKTINGKVSVLGIVALLKSTFDYFNTEMNQNMMSILVDDILDMWGWMSALEIIKAITEGRRNTTELYGKLSGKQINEWIADYDQKMQIELQDHRRNEKFETQKKIDSLEFPDEVKDKFKWIDPEEHAKREHTHQEKVQALNDLRISPEEKRRREYSRKWTQKDGDFKTYMDKFK